MMRTRRGARAVADTSPRFGFSDAPVTIAPRRDRALPCPVTVPCRLAVGQYQERGRYEYQFVNARPRIHRSRSMTVPLRTTPPRPMCSLDGANTGLPFTEGRKPKDCNWLRQPLEPLN